MSESQLSVGPASAELDSHTGAVAEIEAQVCGDTGVDALTSSGARDRLASAIGRQASGLRATAFLSGTELARSIDLLAQATRRRLPLVVHLAAQGDHRAYHAASATGAVLLFASEMQEAVDLTLIARRVAEAALVPALVATDDPATRLADPGLPEPEATHRYLGRAGDTIQPPTPAQEMLFGKHRRRVPRWHDAGRPLLTGAIGGGQIVTVAELARRACFDTHLPELLEQALDAWACETGRRHDPVSSHRVRGAKLLLVAQGAAVETAEAVADRLRSSRGPRVGVLGVRALRPLPTERLVHLLRGRRAVAVLERSGAPAGAETPMAAELRTVLDRARENDRFGKSVHPGLAALAAKELPLLTSVIYGLGCIDTSDADLAALCRELADKGSEPRSPIYLGLGTTATDYPKRQAHLDALRRSYPQIARLGVRAEVAAGAATAGSAGSDRRPPAAVRRMAPSRAPLADLAGFGDRVGVLYRAGDASNLIPDPFLASGALPPMAAAFSATAPERLSADGTTLLPAFDPTPCTGCGDCWSACPDGAVGPLPIGPRELLDGGMRLAQRRGRSVDKLRMVTSKLADRLKTTVACNPEAGGALGEILDAAFAPLIDKMKLPDERKAQVREAYGAVRDELAELPVARTAPFFDSAGDLFTLAIDPDACKGCGLCVAECKPKALTALDDSAERRLAARELWRLHEELPQPSAAVLEAAASHPEVGPLAGALLSRSAREVMTVAGSEAGSGEALAARQVLGTLAALRRPLLERHLAEVEELRSQLAEAIHDQLSHALPDRDLEALARGLDALDQPDAELAELTERVETTFETERVDVPGTRRLVEAGRQLADLARRLEKGEGGLGRAPFGVVLAGSPATWGGTFPHNPFAVPATVAAAGAGAAMARGLLEGHLRQTLEDVRVLRLARAELERAGGRRGHDDDDELSWQALDAGERRLCPPLILLASEAALAGPDLGVTLTALDTDLPLKIVALSYADAGHTGIADLGLLALTSRWAFVAQSSIARFDHLGRILAQALAHEGPTFVRILAPSPARGDFAASAALEQARAAVAAGELKLWSSDPEERSGRSLADLLLEPASGADAPPEETPEDDAAESVPTAAANAELKQQHVAELAAVRAQYEAQIAQLCAGLNTKMAQQIRGRLMQLVAGARAPDAPLYPDELDLEK